MKPIVLRCTEQIEVHAVDPSAPIGVEFGGQRFAVMLTAENVWGLLNSKCSEMDTGHAPDCHKLLLSLLSAGYKAHLFTSYKALFAWLTGNE